MAELTLQSTGGLDKPYVIFRTYTLLVLTDASNLMIELERMTNKLADAMRSAFNSRGAIPLVHSQSHQIEFNYDIPDPSGDMSRFRLSIELQVRKLQTAVNAPPSLAIVPRMIAEWVHLALDNVYMMEESDADFAGLVDEVQRIILSVSEANVDGPPPKS